METWPSYGRLELQGLSGGPASAVLRTETETGHVKQTVVRSLQLDPRELTYVYTDTEFASWELWYRDNINRGNDFFNWVDFKDGAIKLARIVRGEYSYSPFTEFQGAPLSYRVRLSLETIG